MAATAVFSWQASLRRVDRCFHRRAIQHYQWVVMCSLYMAQLHFRKSLQLNLLLQNCYLLHRREMAIALASRQAQATHQERIMPTPLAPNPTPSPTVEVAVFSVETGEEKTLAPKTPPLTPATKINFGRSLPARCPAVTWSLSDGYSSDDYTKDDSTPGTLAPDTPPAYDPEYWHPEGPYDPAYDVDSPEWDCTLWHEAHEARDKSHEYNSPTPPPLTSAMLKTTFDPSLSARYPAMAWNQGQGYYADDDAMVDSASDSSERVLSPSHLEHRLQLRLRSAHDKIYFKRHGECDYTPRNHEFYEDWAWARTKCNGTDYAQDHPDSCFDTDYQTDYDSDLEIFLGSDCETSEIFPA